MSVLRNMDRAEMERIMMTMPIDTPPLERLEQLQEARATTDGFCSQRSLMERSPTGKPPMHISWDAHSKVLLTSVSDLRQEPRLSDITIVMEGQSFRANKILLCAASNYFKAMFTSGFEEANSSEVNIEGNPNIFALLVDFVYTGRLLFTNEQAPQLVKMASYFQFETVLVLLEDYLQKHARAFSFDSVVGIAEAGGQIGEAAKSHLVADFIQFAESPVFKNLPAATVDEFLDRQDLTALSQSITEDDVLKAVCGWLRHSWNDRRVYADQLLRKVRLGVVSSQNLSTCFGNEIRADCSGLYASLTNDDFRMANQELFTPRGVTVMMRVTTGFEDTLVTEYFSTKTLNWHPIRTLEMMPKGTYNRGVQPSNMHRKCVDQMISSGKDLYINLEQDPACKTSFYWLNKATNKWNVRDCLKEQVTDAVWVPIDKYIYVVGGHRGMFRPFENIFQTFDTVAKRWKEPTCLPIPDGFVFSPSARPVATACDGNLVVCATLMNEDDQARTCSAWIFKYTTDTGSWERIPIQESTSLENISLIADGRKLYLVSYVSPERNTRPNVPERLNLPVYVPDTTRSIRNGEPQINELIFRENPPSYALGEAYDQGSVPENTVGAFCIGEDVYLNLNGFIHKLSIIKFSTDETGLEELRRVLLAIGKHQPGFPQMNLKEVFLEHTFQKFSIKHGFTVK